MKKWINALVLALIILIVVPVVSVHAEDNQSIKQGYYGVGSQVGEPGFSLGGFTHLELVIVDSVGMYGQPKEINGFVADGKVLAFVGVGADGSFSRPLFTVKAVGNATLPLPFFPVFPALSVGLEDIHLNLKNDNLSAASLVGLSMYLPVSVFTDILKGKAYVGATVGARFNTEAKDGAWAYAPKLRYINGSISVDAHYLKTVKSAEVKESSMVLTVSYNDLFRKSDHAGVHVSRMHLDEDENNHELNVVDSVIFYGWQW